MSLVYKVEAAKVLPPRVVALPGLELHNHQGTERSTFYRERGVSSCSTASPM